MRIKVVGDLYWGPVIRGNCHVCRVVERDEKRIDIHRAI